MPDPDPAQTLIDAATAEVTAHNVHKTAAEKAAASAAQAKTDADAEAAAAATLETAREAVLQAANALAAS